MSGFGQEEIPAYKTKKPVQIDGILDEGDWRKAPDADIFIYTQSDREEHEKVTTEVKILFDDKFLYLGFVCNDTEPEQLLSSINTRDGDVRDDDSVYVLMEANRDLEKYYFFGTNLLGAKYDGHVDKNGRIGNPGWNGKWESAGIKTSSGWSAEIAIDLSSLQYPPQDNISVRLSLSRVVPRLDSIFRRGLLDPAFDLDQIGELKSLDLIRTYKRATLESHIMSLSESGNRTTGLGGFDLTYAFNLKTTGRAVANPDFITSEPDNERVNLTPYELYMPEKRGFFIDSSLIFKKKINLFYSKRIGDIFGGASIKGKFGKLEYNGVSVISENDPSLDLETANYSAAQITQRFAGSSSVGFTAVNKLAGGKSIGTAGFEGNIYLTKSLSISGQFAASYGDFQKDNLAYFLSSDYSTDSFHAHLSYFRLDKNFGDNVNHVGFIPDDNRKEIDAAVNKAFLFQKGGIRSINYDSNYNIYWGTEGTLRSWQIDEALSMYLRNNWHITVHYSREYKLNENIRIPVLTTLYSDPDAEWIVPTFKHYIDFNNYRLRLLSGWDNQEGSRFSLEYTMGKHFDLDFQLMKISKNLNITRTLNMAADFYSINFEGNLDPNFQRNTIFVIKAKQYFTPEIFVRLFVQSNAIIKKRNILAQCVYHFKPPLGTLQLAYIKGDPLFGVVRNEGDRILLKITFGF